jgi:hypothetical protein
VLVLAGLGIVGLATALVDHSGLGTPLAQKVADVAGGLSVLIGLGLSIASMGIPTPSRSYRSPHEPAAARANRRTSQPPHEPTAARANRRDALLPPVFPK